MKNKIVYIVLIFILSACQVGEPEPTATSTNTATPTHTPTFTLTLEPTSTIAPTSTPKPKQDYPGTIVYTRVNRGYELFVMTSDEENQTKLTDYTPERKAVFGATWSPDMKYIAFKIYDIDEEVILIGILDIGIGEILEHFIENYDGGEFSWTPDNRFLIYAADQPDGFEQDIYKLELSTNKTINLTNGYKWDNFPDVSPDGTQIVFVSDRAILDDIPTYDDIWVMDLNGQNLINLTGIYPWWEDTYPVWSPNGEKITFYKSSTIAPEEGGPSGLWVMDNNGENQMNVVDEDILSFIPPVWSPDGKYIAYVAGVNETDIYIVPSDGSGEPINVSNLPGENDNITWSPDSKVIVFMNSEDGDWHLYMVRFDGSELQMLLGDVESGWADWTP